MYAVDDLGDAIDVTRNFLTPIDVHHWLKLTVVVLFLGGLSVSPPSTPTGEPSPAPGPVPANPLAELPVTRDQLIQLAIVFVLIGLVVWLVIALVGALMQFVLIDALRSGSVTLRTGLGEHFGKGLSLFAFELALGVLGFLLVAVPTYVLVFPVESIERISPSSIAGLIVLALFVALAYALVVGLTTAFVVPVMLLEDRGIRGGWGRFWTTLRANLDEYVVYVILTAVVSIVASIAVGLLAAITLFVLAIPFVLLGFVGLLLGPLALPVLVLLGFLAFVTILFVTALFRMPVVVYLRYYALLVLGDTDPRLDLIPNRREAVRRGSGWNDRRDRGVTDDGPSWRGPDSDDGSNDGGDESSDWGYRDEP